jgi:DNA-binding transcriptional regulator GbsR (MarR family)
MINHRGPYGMTWAELAEVTGLHHGQVSGALSKLHEMGRLFQRRDTRNGCHPYVHSDYRHEFDDNEVNDEPVKTRSTVLREAYQDLETAAWNLLYSQAGGSAEKWNHLRNAVKQLEELKND